MNKYHAKMRDLNALPVGFGLGQMPVKVSEDTILWAEGILGARLPDDYREYVRDFSGFVLDVTFPVQSTDYDYMDSLETICGIVLSDEDQAFDIVRSYQGRNIDVMDDNWISLGWNSGSGGSVYAFKGPDRGKVFSLDEDFLPCLVANSFDEFMNLLTKMFDEPEVKERAEIFWKTFSTE